MDVVAMHDLNSLMGGSKNQSLGLDELNDELDMVHF